MLQDVNQRCLHICLQPLHVDKCVTFKVPFSLALLLFVRKPYVTWLNSNYPVLIDVLEVAVLQERDRVLG